MKFKSTNEKHRSGFFYGLQFDEDGICDADKEVAKSLVDAGKLEPVKGSKSKDSE